MWRTLLNFGDDPIDKGWWRRGKSAGEKHMSSSSVRLLCPNLKCRTILSVPASARGKTVRCRSCSMRVQVPAGNNKPNAPKPASDSTANAGGKP